MHSKVYHYTQEVWEYHTSPFTPLPASASTHNAHRCSLPPPVDIIPYWSNQKPPSSEGSWRAAPRTVMGCYNGSREKRRRCSWRFRLIRRLHHVRQIPMAPFPSSHSLPSSSSYQTLSSPSSPITAPPHLSQPPPPASLRPFPSLHRPPACSLPPSSLACFSPSQRTATCSSFCKPGWSALSLTLGRSKPSSPSPPAEHSLLVAWRWASQHCTSDNC